MNVRRESLIGQLEAYARQQPDSAMHVERFKSLLEMAHCFQRDHFVPGHITASAWVLDPTLKKVLLTHHRKLDKWLQLGGHTDGNENTLESALREAYEESGLKQIAVFDDAIFDVDIHLIPSRGKEPEHEHFDIRYAFVCEGDTQYDVSDESNDLKWIPVTSFGFHNGRAFNAPHGSALDGNTCRSDRCFRTKINR